MWHLLQQQYFAAVHRGLHLILLVIPAALPSAAPAPAAAAPAHGATSRY